MCYTRLQSTNLCKETQMKFYHHINPNNKGGVTLAYEVAENHQGKTLLISFAQCSKKDYYCKRTGRDRALNKYIDGNITAIVVKGSIGSIKNRIQAYLPFLASNINNLQAN